MPEARKLHRIPVPSGHELIFDGDLHMDEDLKVGRQGSYAFESRTLQKSDFESVELRKVYRQARDIGLFEFLNDMREGHPDLAIKHQDILHSLQKSLPKRDDSIIPTELHSKNSVVDLRNRQELEKIPHECISFSSTDKYDLADEYLARFLSKHNSPNTSNSSYDYLISRKSSLPGRVKNALKGDKRQFQAHEDETFFFSKEVRVAQTLHLKKEAQVMLLWNLDIIKKLANGSRGIVVGFFDPVEYLEFLTI